MSNALLRNLERNLGRSEAQKPKPKSTLDLVKEWGGVVSLLIALGYTFPLGFWDRFIDKSAARSAEIADLYAVLENISSMVSERTMLGSQMPIAPNSSMTIDGTLMARADLLMSRRKDKFIARKDDLTFSALYLASQAFGNTGDFSSALIMIDEAIERAGSDAEMKLAAMRDKATLYFLATAHRDQATGRQLFKDILAQSQQLGLRKSAFISAAISAQWSLAELNDGDWKCGLQVLEGGEQAAQENLPPDVWQPIFGPIRGQVMSNTLRPTRDQPQVGC